ncbi:MAG: PDZ domain-containing protein [Pseudomonadota bacterium]
MLDKQRMRIFGLGLGLVLLVATLSIIGKQGGQISPDSARTAFIHAPDGMFTASGNDRTPHPGEPMYLDQQAVDDIVQRVLRNVEKSLLNDEQPAVLGIIASDRQATGVRITGVTPDGPAHQAGLRSGDVILAMNGEPLVANGVATALDRLRDQLSSASAGEHVSVRFARNDRMRYADVILGDLAALPRVPSAPEPAVLRERWADLELVPMSEGLGTYFGTQDGLLVTRVPHEEPAWGLQDGDVIQRIGDRVPRSAEHALEILETYVPGEALRLSIVRGGETRELTIADGLAAAPGEILEVDDDVHAPFPTGPWFALEDPSTACVMRRL